MLCDREIYELWRSKHMISPFVNKQINKDDNNRKIVSYGLTSFGYDIRLANKYKVFNNRCGLLIDPLNFDSKVLTEEEGDYCVIPPNSYILGYSMEHFDIPDNIVADCVGKSTYARCGIIINVTPLEPGWCGHLTIEISNSTPLPAKVYANMGIAQIRFFKGQMPSCSYKDRSGKYMDQAAEPVIARI